MINISQRSIMALALAGSAAVAAAAIPQSTPKSPQVPAAAQGTTPAKSPAEKPEAAPLAPIEVAALRRLSPSEYRNSIADIFGPEIDVQGTFEPSIRVGGLAAGSSTVLSVTPVGFMSFSQMADSIAAQVASKKYRAKLPCAPKNAKAADDACASKIISQYGMMLFRRPLSQEEVKGRVALLRSVAEKQQNFYLGVRYGLASLLQAPDFVFRREVAVLAADKKSYTLEPYSRAARLSFTLWDTTPDRQLLEAAARGDLNTQAGLEAQIDRLMASPRLEEGMRAFYTDMMQLDDFETVSKDPILYPKWSGNIAMAAREETLRTMIELTLKENGDIRDLMTTRKTFVDRNLAAAYRVPYSFGGDWVPFEFGEGSGRSGVLTQVSMLAMFSHPGRSSPTKRGVALTDILLCEPTPSPPADVDFTAATDESSGKTVRERLSAHATNRACASCHNHSDPVGLALENFDTIGGHRTTDNGAPIDASVTFQGKAYVGAKGLGEYLHDNPKFPACVARKLFAYGRGEEATSVKTSHFPDSFAAFQKSGYRMRTLLRSMVASPDFYKAPNKQPLKMASLEPNRKSR